MKHIIVRIIRGCSIKIINQITLDNNDPKTPTYLVPLQNAGEGEGEGDGGGLKN
jgi:hypothetical protein